MTIRLGFKHCPRCDTTKPRSDFAKDGSSVQSACKECKRARNREWFASHRERKADRVAEYRATNPDKYAAHRAVQNALRTGRIFKPSACVHCAATCILEAHHPDYSKPLEVLWLCRSCHRAVHNAERKETA